MHFYGSRINHTPSKERAWYPPNESPWVGETDNASKCHLIGTGPKIPFYKYGLFQQFGGRVTKGAISVQELAFIA